jgi:response regulator RpfG family c-di-GMP phosphodiesterase
VNVPPFDYEERSHPLSSGLAMSVPEFISRDQVSVLIADDDPLVRCLAQNILAQDGYLILTACDGQRALDVLAAHPGPLHLILSDVKMPRLQWP